MKNLVKAKTQKVNSRKQASSPVQRRVLALVVCLIFIPFAFDRLDRAFVMPERLKALVTLFNIEPTITERIWRVRLGVSHQGVEPHDVEITLTWLDDDNQELGRNERRLTMGPGDTSYVSLSYINNSQDVRAVRHKLDYHVESTGTD